MRAPAAANSHRLDWLALACMAVFSIPITRSSLPSNPAVLRALTWCDEEHAAQSARFGCVPDALLHKDILAALIKLDGLSFLRLLEQKAHGTGQ
jgi:hypothetical protein